MPQVKKTEVKAAILDAAFVLFMESGYSATSMPSIASLAGITAGNIYRYYKSKFELFYAVLEPWLNSRLDVLEHEIAELSGDREKLQRILFFMWIELPRADNNFLVNLMEALATKKSNEPYSRSLLKTSEQRITAMLEVIFPPRIKRLFSVEDISHLIFMCHDGFVLNVNLAEESNKVQKTIDGIVSLVAGGK